jgi:uncharacterized protein
MKFLSIDYGAKLAGTTVVCFAKNGCLHFQQPAKKQDADAWLHSIVAEHKPSAIYMDAPLSLPIVYKGEGNNYHYRHCDQVVGAMSPMFLGGLTARAMQFRAAFPQIPFYEAYPAQAVRTLFLGDIGYKTDLTAFLEKLAKRLPYPFAQQPINWHQVDAALTWFTGWRHDRGEAISYGNGEEGLIWV